MSKQAGGIIPQITLHVVDKANYKGPIDGIPTFEERGGSMSAEELAKSQESIAIMAKQRGVPVELVEEEIKNSTTTTCSDLEDSSTSDINGKTFAVSSKECSTALGPFMHKTYLYEDNDRVYALSMHAIQPIGMMKAFANTFSAQHFLKPFTIEFISSNKNFDNVAEERFPDINKVYPIENGFMKLEKVYFIS